MIRVRRSVVLVAILLTFPVHPAAIVPEHATARHFEIGRVIGFLLFYCGNFECGPDGCRQKRER